MPATILRPYFLSFRNRWRFRDRMNHGFKRDLLLALVALMIMVCIFVACVMLFRALADRPAFVLLLPPRMIDLAYYYFFVLLLVSNTVAATGNIYSSENMSLFLSAPVSAPRLYVAKFLETLFETSIMFFIFMFPAGLAYVVALGLSWKFLACGVGVSLLFLAIPVGIGIVMATMFANIISFIWRRGFVLALALVAVFGWVFFRLSHELTVARATKTGSRVLVGMSGIYDNQNPYWLPSRWVSDILSSFLGAPIERPAVNALLLLSAAVASLLLGYLVFDLLALRVRSIASISHRVSSRTSVARKASDTLRSWFERIYSFVPVDQQIRAVILKDLSSLVRDRAQALQLLLYLGIATLYVSVFGFMGAAWEMAPIALQLWWAFLASMNVLFAGFILTTVMTRLVYPSVSLEGRAFWILQVTPIETRKLVRSKFFCWLPVTALITLSLLLSGLLAIGMNFSIIVFTFVVGCALSIGYTGLAIGIGSSFASFDWESPSQIAVGFGTLVLLFSSLTILMAMLVPCSYTLFLLAVPNLRLIFGPIASFFLMSGALFSVVFSNFLIAKYACDWGARGLERRRNG